MAKFVIEIICPERQKDLTQEEIDLLIDLWRESPTLVPHEKFEGGVRLFPPLNN